MQFRFATSTKQSISSRHSINTKRLFCIHHCHSLHRLQLIEKLIHNVAHQKLYIMCPTLILDPPKILYIVISHSHLHTERKLYILNDIFIVQPQKIAGTDGLNYYEKTSKTLPFCRLKNAGQTYFFFNVIYCIVIFRLRN